MSVERLDLTDRLGASPGYSYVARARGTLVYTAGAVPVDPRGDLIGPGDVAGQTQAAIANLALALEAAGAAPEDVVKTTLYVVGEHDDLLSAWDAFAKGPYVAAPATLLGVAGLGYTGQLVEIEAVAVLD